MSLGEKLRQEREKRGISLAQIAQETRIGTRYLEALEKGDTSTLPRDFFYRSFVRQYANHLGLESGEVDGLLEAEMGKPAATPVVAAPARSGSEAQRAVPLAAAGMAATGESLGFHAGEPHDFGLDGAGGGSAGGIGFVPGMGSHALEWAEGASPPGDHGRRDVGGGSQEDSPRGSRHRDHDLRHDDSGSNEPGLRLAEDRDFGEGEDLDSVGRGWGARCSWGAGTGAKPRGGKCHAGEAP